MLTLEKFSNEKQGAISNYFFRHFPSHFCSNDKGLILKRDDEEK